MQDTGIGVAVTIFGNGKKYSGIIDGMGETGNLPKVVVKETTRFLNNFGEKTNYVLERCSSVLANVYIQGKIRVNKISVTFQ